MTRGAARLSVALATATKNEVLRRYLEERMDKPRIFLGSSGKQANLLLALTRGLEDIAHVDPWTTSFNPGTTTLERLLELTHEVDFAAFVFAQDDWTTNNPQGSPAPGAGQASPRDNVVFEAGLFGGTLGMRRTFILHASGAKVAGRSWQEDGRLSARYWSEAVKERKEPSGVFYYWNGERPLNPNAPRLYGTGEIRMESAERASGYFTTRADTHPKVDTRTSGVYWRAAAEDLSVMDGREEGKRAELIAERLQHWKSIKNA